MTTYTTATEGVPNPGRQHLVLLPQITITGLLDGIEGLDAADFVAKTRMLFDYVLEPPNRPDHPYFDLISGLYDVPLDGGTSAEEWFGRYWHAGVDRGWLEVLMNLRVLDHAGTSMLVHPDVGERVELSLKRVGDSSTLEQTEFGPRSIVLRPKARTLGISLRRFPGSWETARVPPPVISGDDKLEELADAVAARIRPTVGGDKYLEPDAKGRALAVLAATVAAVLSHDSSHRWRRRQVVVRGDVYRQVFEALELADYFETARRFLEVAHPFHLPVRAPWPPGEGRSPEEVGILRYEDGFLVLHPRASLRLGGE